jgi:hypothetical protein
MKDLELVGSLRRLRYNLDRLLGYDNKYDLEHEVACHLVSNWKVDMMPISDLAKRLNRELLQKVDESTTVEEALEHVLELALELEKDVKCNE